MKNAISLSPATRTDWRALHYFNLYRIVLAGFFAVLVWSDNLPDPLGEYDQTLFGALVYAYLIYSIATAFIIQKQLLPYQMQVAIHVIIDIVILSFMMYASGGLKSGFGLLIVITVACGSILSARQIAILFAAIAAIMMLGHEAYIQLSRYFPGPNYTQAAFHGIAFFITSIAGQLISSRLKTSEALAEQRALDIQSLAKLNEQIVQRMQSGIIAVDEDGTIRLMNNSAKLMLGYEGEVFSKSLAVVAPELAVSYGEWQVNKQSYTNEIYTSDSNIDIKVGIVEIDRGRIKTSLIFLDDLTKMRQQAQSLKLASLGRLTASIAHEIRNPLGAISHAGQLLDESSYITDDDNRLTQIIKDQSIRINLIIENVLNMSRREPPLVEEIQLQDWLSKFIQEFTQGTQVSMEDIRLEIIPEDLSVFMDISQLHQVLWNLSQNACRYSKGKIKIQYQCGIHDLTNRVYIDVIDSGPGIEKEKEQHLFEPFYTTEKEGTGLGLYISRELCEMNQATLSLTESSEQGCRFRIQFPHNQQSKT